jgi:DNA-directed RNA polymerase specialized sigma24 family protein
VADECRRLLDRLGDESLRSVAVWKMEGQTNAAIAARLGCVASTVERKLNRIRELWAREGLS